MFFEMQKYVYSESVFNTIYTEIKQLLKKFPSDKINSTKNAYIKKCYKKFLFLFKKMHGFFDFKMS